MSSQVTELKEKLMSQFAALSEREQRLVGITALVAVVFISAAVFY